VKEKSPQNREQESLAFALFIFLLVAVEAAFFFGFSVAQRSWWALAFGFFTLFVITLFLCVIYKASK